MGWRRETLAIEGELQRAGVGDRCLRGECRDVQRSDQRPLYLRPERDSNRRRPTVVPAGQQGFAADAQLLHEREPGRDQRAVDVTATWECCQACAWRGQNWRCSGVIVNKKAS